MFRKTLSVYFASVAMIAAVAPAQSADDEIPLYIYTRYLLDTYGADAVVKLWPLLS